MLLPIKPIYSAAKARRDGTSLIFIQYCFSSENKTLLNTEIAVPSSYWHKKLNRIADNLPSLYGKANELTVFIFIFFITTILEICLGDFCKEFKSCSFPNLKFL